MAALFHQHAAAPLIGFSVQRRAAAPRRGRNPSLTRLRVSRAEPSSNKYWKQASEAVVRSSSEDDDDELKEEEERERELAEELESMEEEVLMAGAAGDEGREPLDYDRRARLFDKSSRVFQALKGRLSHHDGDINS